MLLLVTGAPLTTTKCFWDRDIYLFQLPIYVNLSRESNLMGNTRMFE